MAKQPIATAVNIKKQSLEGLHSSKLWPDWNHRENKGNLSWSRLPPPPSPGHCHLERHGGAEGPVHSQAGACSGMASQTGSSRLWASYWHGSLPACLLKAEDKHSFKTERPPFPQHWLCFEQRGFGYCSLGASAEIPSLGSTGSH